jgi:GNAT superfamily N-acetyltransferase
VQLIEVRSVEDVSDSEIRERLHNKAQYTRQYVLREGTLEVGFLSLDPIPDREYLTLYEVFVPKAHRNRGIGARLLGEAEWLARKWGYRSVVVWPKPFERDYPKEKLIAWYQQHGFKEWPLNLDNLEKKLTRYC